MKRIAQLFTIALIFVAANLSAQTYKVAAGSEIKVLGTSNIHDWVMTATQLSGDAQLVLKGNALQDVSALNFSLAVKNLKAKENSMTGRAHKAMDADKYPNISFKLAKADVADQQVKANGTLTIGGTSKAVDLQGKITANADGSFLIKGSRKIKMSEYGIKPPSYMLGAMKVYDDLTIEYTLKLQK
ncbi:hypothetical protein PBAL39_07280 [Pedobacter sp. BAL39]|uniref:YceI family protein n=1 Tax=Pedobacter sp. BAL39 TaxID=391596 RepID=UPI0001559A47|nr:YceI family protein [Pedobacter sp. BAL39]EDM35470.1 hypothetical protein PBAL39_07280 [Pedobacter sp. BAL39]